MPSPSVLLKADDIKRDETMRTDVQHELGGDACLAQGSLVEEAFVSQVVEFHDLHERRSYASV